MNTKNNHKIGKEQET